MAGRAVERAVAPRDSYCLELTDHSTARVAAGGLFGVSDRRDAASAARLAEQFLARNRPLLGEMNVRGWTEYDGREVMLALEAGSGVGAIPLFSPTSARPDYGLVIQPRYAWAGIGPMLAEMGWRVAPAPLRLPLLRRSERRVPAWVLSSMILVRMRALLDTLDRRFEVAREELAAPRGQVDWAGYATRQLPRARVLALPCAFPDLRDDRQLKGAVRYTVEKQIRSLEEQRGQGAFVHRLLEVGREVERRVRDVPAYVPSRGTMDAWLQRPLRAQHFLDGIEGIQWTAEDRGLAGVSDLAGIPWRMPMEAFFEAWVETVLGRVAQRTGGRLKAGRRRETVQAIEWRPGFHGSQRSLAPDFRIAYEDLTVIVDAKYKRHWEELQLHGWARAEEQMREQHRHDLLQVLAYGGLTAARNVVACLAYPCSAEKWDQLREQGRLHHQAEIPVGDRMVRLWLTAMPMARAAEAVAAPLAEELQGLLPAG